MLPCRSLYRGTTLEDASGRARPSRLTLQNSFYTFLRLPLSEGFVHFVPVTGRKIFAASLVIALLHHESTDDLLHGVSQFVRVAYGTAGRCNYLSNSSRYSVKERGFHVCRQFLDTFVVARYFQPKFREFIHYSVISCIGSEWLQCDLNSRK